MNTTSRGRYERVVRVAARWAKELTDESGRNLLLYYKELKSGTLSLDEAVLSKRKALLNGRKVRIQELFTGDKAADALRRTRAVNRKATVNYEERGIKTLFLGWGMATWTPVSSSATPAAPVLLCPIELERTGAAEVDFKMKLSGDWTLNEALLQHLENEFSVDVSGERLMDPYGDGEQLTEDEEQAIFAELLRRAGRVPSFAIAERVVMGNFMFKKMPMVKDINNNLEALAQHDLIAAIAGDEKAGEAVRATRAETVDPSLPDRTPPASEFLVLDADASQNAAINAALAEESFVLQGPPGTGKSQTISNLIAVMMAEGRSVLFVAEKRAAIDAVAKRLTKVGLDRFVMDLHGGVSSRKELARRLNESLGVISRTPPVDHDGLHRSLETSREELSGYAESLHQEREPWGMSYFEVLSQLLPIRASESPAGGGPRAPMQFPSSALRELNQANAQQVRSDLRDWADLSEPLRSGRSPWTGAQITADDGVQSALSACINLAGEFTSSWQTQQKLLSNELGIDESGSVTRWAQVIAEVPEMARNVSNAEAVLTLEVFNQDLDKLVQDMAPATRSGLGKLSDDLGIDKPRSAAEWAQVIAEVPEMARNVSNAEAVLTLEVFNQDLDKLVQDMAPATRSGLGKLSDDLGIDKPRSAAEWAQVIAEVPEMARNVSNAEAVLTLEVFNQDLDKLVQDMAPAIRSVPSRLLNKLFNKRYKSALAQLEHLKPGLSETNARTLYDEVDAARTLAQRWAGLDCPGSPQVLANIANTPEEIAELAQRYKSALAQLEHLKPGLSETNARTLYDEVDAARTLAQRWAELDCPGSPQVLANIANTPEEIAELAQRYKSALAQLEHLKPGLSETNARTLYDEVDAARTLAQRWTELDCPGSPQLLTSADAAFKAFERMKRALDDLSSLIPERNFAERTAGEVARISEELLSDQQTLFSLPRLVEVEQRLREAHVGPLIDKVGDNALLAHSLESAFDHSWLQSIQREVLSSDRRLSGFQGTRQSRYVGEFQQADAEHLEHTAARVARRIAERAVGALSQCTDEDRLIRKEASKKTRHLPLRRLFEQAPTALTVLRPCWAMSPLDVAQTLPPEPIFDLVVFDEASQVMPCDAISAILRGKRAMVAGDSRQLPPTSFFDSSGRDDDLDEDEESITDYESILDVLDAMLSRRPLTWHYRSQDERLIAYSNRHIYRRSLTTFPGADADQCLDWVLAPHEMGMRTEKGSNSGEVQRVVDLMIDHARQRPTESLGVIAMGRYHSDRIDETLRKRIEQERSPELEEFFADSREEPAFVKNLEWVQGDERDAIILSIGYGKNADGRMQYRFGPLNLQGGERRLNVGITRARKRMTLVSSFDYADMDPDRTRATGAKLLRGFLKFAQSGGTELDGADDPEPLNAFEVDVLDKLERAGLSVVPQYGCSGYRIDFAVRHPEKPGQYALAVEADGASYHSSPTARDRDRLRQEHLERLGWRFCRIWSTDWFNDHQSEVRRVIAAYETALAEINSGKIVSRNSDSGSDSSRDVPVVGVPYGETDSAPRRGSAPGIWVYDSIDEYSHEELVAIARWIESDGLLRTNAQLFEEVFDELPFKRRGSRIEEAINAAIASARKRRPQT